MNDRQSESDKAARILRRIHEVKRPIPGVPRKERDWALELAISLLEARANDAEGEKT
jgi:hypothetical protein